MGTKHKKTRHKKTAPATSSLLAPSEVVERAIFVVRGQKVMLDSDLAALYQVETKALNRAVKRNLSRFPEDFMFRLNSAEVENLRCQIGTSSWGGRRTYPYVFTEHGAVMLATVLNSRRAIHMSLVIVRTFSRMREVMATHKELAQKVDVLERTQRKQGRDISTICHALETLMESPKRRIGFSAPSGSEERKR